jgi:hypothetical protein
MPSHWGAALGGAIASVTGAGTGSLTLPEDANLGRPAS